MHTVTLKGTILPIDEKRTKAVMTTQIKVKDLLTKYKIDSSVNRDVNVARLPKIVNYINGYDNFPGIFFPAIMCAYSGDPTKNYNVHLSELVIPSTENLIVIDGQHRIMSLEKFVNDKKIEAARKDKILNSDLTMQLYFGLSQEDMRSLFAEINSNAVKVSMSLVTAYDTREILNILVNELHEVSNSLKTLGVEFNKSRLVRPKNTNFITSARLKTFLSILLFGKKQLSLKEQQIIKDNYDQIISFLERFFYCLTTSFPKESGNVLLYVLGHEAVQNAIAINIHNEIIDYADTKLSWAIDWEDRLEEIVDIDWSINNSLWKPFLLKAKANTVSEFLTIDIKDESVITKQLREVLFV